MSSKQKFIRNILKNYKKFNDKTWIELYIKYKQFDYLKAYEYIDFEGNVNGLYSCEYGFMWGFLSSNIIKLNIINLLLIILFLQ